MAASTGATPQGRAAEAFLGRRTWKHFGGDCWREGVVESTRADAMQGQLWCVEYDEGESFEELSWEELCTTLAPGGTLCAPGTQAAPLLPEPPAPRQPRQLDEAAAARGAGPAHAAADSHVVPCDATGSRRGAGALPPADVLRRFKGLTWHADTLEWSVQLWHPVARCNVSCGRFAADKAEDAARAYDEAVRSYGGTEVNFPRRRTSETQALGSKPPRKARAAAADAGVARPARMRPPIARAAGAAAAGNSRRHDSKDISLGAPRYRGVAWRHSDKIWEVRITDGHGRKAYLGRFAADQAEAAARCYDAAVRARGGTVVNFPRRGTADTQARFVGCGRKHAASASAGGGRSAGAGPSGEDDSDEASESSESDEEDNAEAALDQRARPACGSLPRRRPPASRRAGAAGAAGAGRGAADAPMPPPGAARYKGVGWHADTGTWRVRFPSGERKLLGRFAADQAEAAARCYDAAVRARGGTEVNFPRPGTAETQACFRAGGVKQHAAARRTGRAAAAVASSDDDSESGSDDSESERAAPGFPPDEAEEAARAYDDAKRKRGGTEVNFPRRGTAETKALPRASHAKPAAGGGRAALPAEAAAALPVAAGRNQQHAEAVPMPSVSRHRGVVWDNARGMWRAQLHNKGVCMKLGYFAADKAEQAARCYDAAARKRGRLELNFPKRGTAETQAYFRSESQPLAARTRSRTAAAEAEADDSGSGSGSKEHADAVQARATHAQLERTHLPAAAAGHQQPPPPMPSQPAPPTQPHELQQQQGPLQQPCPERSARHSRSRSRSLHQERRRSLSRSRSRERHHRRSRSRSRGRDRHHSHARRRVRYRSRSRSRSRSHRRRRSHAPRRERHGHSSRSQSPRRGRYCSRSPHRGDYGHRSRSRSRSRQHKQLRERHSSIDHSRRRSAAPAPTALPEFAAACTPPQAAAAAAAAAVAAAAAPLPAPAAAMPSSTADAIWYYDTPESGVQGPFSLAQLASFRPFPEHAQLWATLRVWHTGQTAADGVLLASLLSPA